jgi:hypothetical protein
MILNPEAGKPTRRLKRPPHTGTLKGNISRPRSSGG